MSRSARHTTAPPMPITDYQAKYLAHELTRRYPAGAVDTLASALVDAQVELNPHQVDAALFAFRSPLSRGALLADEVGLGKTIEAGLVISQRWAERPHRILVVAPASAREQQWPFSIVGTSYNAVHQSMHDSRDR